MEVDFDIYGSPPPFFKGISGLFFGSMDLSSACGSGGDVYYCHDFVWFENENYIVFLR